MWSAFRLGLHRRRHRTPNGEGFARVLPTVSTATMNRFLAGFAKIPALGEHASATLVVPGNATVVSLSPHAPECNFQGLLKR